MAKRKKKSNLPPKPYPVGKEFSPLPASPARRIACGKIQLQVITRIERRINDEHEQVFRIIKRTQEVNDNKIKRMQEANDNYFHLIDSQLRAQVRCK